MNIDDEDLEYEVLVNRYIYYVIGTRILSDLEYDCLESKALEEVSEDSVINDPGSSLRSSYNEDVRSEAVNRLEELTGTSYKEYL